MLMFVDSKVLAVIHSCCFHGSPHASQAWRAMALYAIRSISRKIPKSRDQLETHAGSLIVAATDADNLAQMYEGWTAWI